MAITLDPQTEQRIQQAAANGGYNSPSALLGHALDLLDEEKEALSRAHTALQARMELAERELEIGGGVSEEEIEAMLVERRAKRVA